MSRFVLCALGGYLLGSVPFGLLLTRAAGTGDLRAVGSGNIGATNVLRTGRRGLAAATLLLDSLKALCAVLLGRVIAGADGGLLAGLASVLGHLFPVWLGFRGGKGVASGFGVLFAVCWPAGLVAGSVWIAVAKAFGVSSLGALSAFLVAPAVAWVFAGWRPAAMVAMVSVLIFLRHISNIRRLLHGTEPRLGQPP